MKKIRVDDLGKIVTGKTPRTNIPENYGGNVPFLTPTDDLSPMKCRTTLNTISELGLKEVKNCIIPKDSICVSCIGSDMGHAIMTSKATVTNQQFNSIIPSKDYHPEYVYYLMVLLGRMMKSKFGKSSTAVPIVSKSLFSSFEIYIEDDKRKQKEISDVLANIDEKIALNTRMNAELEAMAKQLYDYWFVQFDFPDENGNPYKSSGGKMVYNSTLKREIPAGWEDCEIKDIAEVVNGATPLTTNPDNYGNAIIWITPNDLSNQKSKFVSCGERSITQNGYDSCSTTLMPAGSVLMSSRAPIGLMAIAEVELCTNQGFKNFVPFDMTDNYFLYYYIKEHMAQIEQLGAGTTFREVSRDTMLKFPILKISDRGLYSKWYEQIDSICKEQKNLLLQIRHLTHLRDSLLPMLMNGQVTVE